jgi:hypothetical protein
MPSMPRNALAISAEQVPQPYSRTRPTLTRVCLSALAVVALAIVITDVLGLPGRLGAGLVLVALAMLGGLQADRLMHAAAARRTRPNLRIHR